MVKNLPTMWETWIGPLDWEGGGQRNPLQYSCLETLLGQDRTEQLSTAHAHEK